MFDYKIKEVNS